MIPKRGKSKAGSMAVMDRGRTSVTQYTAMSKSTNAHSATCRKRGNIDNKIRAASESSYYFTI